MFDNCPLLALIEAKNKSTQVKRISEDRASQQAIDTTFSTAAVELRRDKTSMDGATEFVDAASIWERRKIASINDSGVLQNFTAAKIKTLARQSGVTIEVVGKKVVLPKDKAKRRIVLGFLDEEVYKGAFSRTVFQTNSKRKAK